MNFMHFVNFKTFMTFSLVNHCFERKVPTFIYDIHQMALDFDSYTYKHTLKKSSYQQIHEHYVTLKRHKNM